LGNENANVTKELPVVSQKDGKSVKEDIQKCRKGYRKIALFYLV